MVVQNEHLAVADHALARLFPERLTTPAALARQNGCPASDLATLKEERALLLRHLLASLPADRLRLPEGVGTVEAVPTAELRVRDLLVRIESGGTVDLRSLGGDSAGLSLEHSFGSAHATPALARTGAFAPERSPGLVSLAAEVGMDEEELKVAAYETLLSFLRPEAINGVGSGGSSGSGSSGGREVEEEAADGLRTIRAQLGISSKRHRAIVQGLRLPDRYAQGQAGAAACAQGEGGPTAVLSW